MAFVDEIARCARLAIPFLVFHPGSHMGAGEAAGVATIARELDICLDEAGETDVTLCIETTAGQGTNLGWRVEHLRDIIGASRHPDRLGICFDTCHVAAAGYGMGDAQEWAATAAAFEAAVGLARIHVLHLNDSKKPRGSRVDRHERIGQGMLGEMPFRLVLREPRLAHALGILEVPGGDEAFAADLALLRRLRSQAAPPPRAGATDDA